MVADGVEKECEFVLRGVIDSLAQKEFSKSIYCRLGKMKSCHGSDIWGWACSDAWLAGVRRAQWWSTDIWLPGWNLVIWESVWKVLVLERD